jgi:hypothetical protein
MKSTKIHLTIFFALIYSLSSFSQSATKTIHPKVTEYSTLVAEYNKTGKADFSKISTVADEINCMLTLDQAKSILPFFVENKMRARSCGSNDYPTTALLNQESVTKYKTSIDSITKK